MQGCRADDHLLPDVPEGMSFCPASSPGTDFRPQAKRDVAVRPERARGAGGAAARRRQCLRPQGAQATADCLFEQRNQCASSAGVQARRAEQAPAEARLRSGTGGAISCPPHDRREHCAQHRGPPTDRFRKSRPQGAIFLRLAVRLVIRADAGYSAFRLRGGCPAHMQHHATRKKT